MTFVDVVICILVAQLCLYSVINRICNCVEYCAAAKALSNAGNVEVKENPKETSYVEPKIDEK